jgi:hypothetical protein
MSTKDNMCDANSSTAGASAGAVEEQVVRVPGQPSTVNSSQKKRRRRNRNKDKAGAAGQAQAGQATSRHPRTPEEQAARLQKFAKTRLSKSLSWLLRHNLVKEGIAIRAGKFVF